jgi:DDE superfamily endonuclease/Tc5 transposase DNA-binding domain
MAKPKQTRQSLQLNQQYSLIQDVESGKFSKKEIMIKYDLRNQCNINSIMKRKEKVISEVEQGNFDSKRKKLRFGDHKLIEDTIIEWMNKIWTPEMRINGQFIQEKAMQLAKERKIEGFAASNGWLEKFRKRFNVEYKTIHGESGGVDQVVVEEWKEKLVMITCEYQPRDIYNGDEFGFFYRCLPNKSMLLKGQSCKGGKQSKLRYTVFVCCNMDGSDKVKLSVIGKSKKPRSFKRNVSLPVDYYNNNRSWMDTFIFNKIMSKMNARLVK